MPYITYLSNLLLAADDGIIALHQLTGANHACNMCAIPTLQIPPVAPHSSRPQINSPGNTTLI